MRVLAMRVMMTGSSDGKITRAVLDLMLEDGAGERRDVQMRVGGCAGASDHC